ncbi:MAG: hypothetical protein FWF68_02240 [Spirochaetes bacterium]|nr:hypothetical protein [Spirochaetota bacterium]
MVLIRILKPAVFIYECIRIIALAFILVYLLYGTSSIPWLAFTAPGALFPIMALFLLIDTLNFKAYIPLYIAGKCIGLFSMALLSVISKQNTIIGGISLYYFSAEIVFFFGDFLALAAILIIFKNLQKSLNKQETITEEKQCE